MRMLYNGTTWNLGTNAAHLRASYDGTGRRYTRYDKRVFDIPWSFVGTDVTTYVGGMAQLDGTVTLEFDRGTYICRAVPGSYRENEVSYQAYNCSIQLKET